MHENHCALTFEKLLEFSLKGAFAVYLRLGESKFVKIVNEGDDALKDILEDYRKKGVSTFYVERSVYQGFQAEIEDQVENSLKNIDPSGDFASNYENMATAMTSIQDLVKNLGMSPKNISLSEELVGSVLGQAESVPNIEVLLELLNTKEGFISKHAFLSSYIVTSILDKMDWATKEVKSRMVMACLFQNIALETEAQAKVYTSAEYEFSNLDEFSQELVLKHPFLAGDLISTGGFSGDDVIRLIKNHHEVPMLGAFPGRLSIHNIPILDACFITGCYFAHLVLLREDKGNYSIIAQEMNEYFSQGGFKRALVALLASLKLISKSGS